MMSSFLDFPTAPHPPELVAIGTSSGSPIAPRTSSSPGPVDSADSRTTWECEAEVPRIHQRPVRRPDQGETSHGELRVRVHRGLDGGDARGPGGVDEGVGRVVRHARLRRRRGRSAVRSVDGGSVRPLDRSRRPPGSAATRSSRPTAWSWRPSWPPTARSSPTAVPWRCTSRSRCSPASVLTGPPVVFVSEDRRRSGGSDPPPGASGSGVRGAVPARSSRQRLHGQVPSISTSSEKLSTIRMRTIMPEHGDALDGRVDDDRAHDVADDQHLEAEQDDPAEVLAQPPVGAVREWRVGPPWRTTSATRAHRPPITMIAAPTPSTTLTTSEMNSS